MDCLKGEGISQRTYIKDPWSWTTVWELIMEVGVADLEEGEGVVTGTTVIA